MFILYRFIVVMLAILFMVLPAGGGAGNQLSRPGKSAQDESLLGTWYGGTGPIQFNKNGTVGYNGQTYYYSAAKDAITFMGADGALVVSYRLTTGKLTLTTSDGKQTIYTRQQPSSGESGRTGAVSAARDLAGKWCYLSNIYASNGGRMSNRCFTLNPNGTYEYYGETSSSGQYGSAASQESDRGMWTATATTLIANSGRYGKRTYRLEKKNHPKTRDPMLVIEGDAYVTYYQKASW